MMKSPLLPIALAALLLANVPVESFVTPSGPVRVLATKSPPLVHIPTTPFSLYLAGSSGASSASSASASTSTSTSLYSSAAAPALQVESKGPLNPSWRSIIEIPIPCDTQEQFDSIPAAKRVAIVSRISVLHLTLLSCLGPLVLRGAVRSSLPAPAQVGIRLTPLLALLFTVDGLSWHACHNLLNDWQDLDDDDNNAASFRLAYGCHALKQGFLSKPAFLRLMAVVSVPGALLTWYFRSTVLVRICSNEFDVQCIYSTTMKISVNSSVFTHSYVHLSRSLLSAYDVGTSGYLRNFRTVLLHHSIQTDCFG
jgi:hypothetical protein